MTTLKPITVTVQFAKDIQFEVTIIQKKICTDAQQNNFKLTKHIWLLAKILSKYNENTQVFGFITFP